MTVVSELIIVTGATLDNLMDWLESMVAVALQEQAENPLRPQCPVMIPRRIPRGHLPIYARPQGKEILGVYDQLPSKADLFGWLVLIIEVEEKSKGDLHLEISRSDDFPMSMDEIRWSLEERFRTRAPPKPTVALRERARSPLEDASAMLADRSNVTGAPPLSCNVWLEQEIRRLPDKDDFNHLYSEWLERYQALKGTPPADPRSSFRAAGKTIVKRLRRTRFDNKPPRA